MLRGFLQSVLGLVVAVVIIGALGAIKLTQFKTMMAAGEAMTMPPTTVNAAVAKGESWESVFESVGTLVAVNGITLTSEVAGTVEKILFQPGQSVDEGKLLVQLESSIEKASLDQAKAQLELSQKDADRTRELFRKKAIAQSDLDRANSELDAAKASLAHAEAALAKKSLRAPFSGKLGIRQISLGQYITAGTPIVSLQSVDPLYADFSLPQKYNSSIATGLKVRLKIDALDQEHVEGTITAINPEVDPKTRNLRLQATIENPSGKISPGMFAAVEVVMPETRQVTAIPVQSVIYAPYGNSVFAVNKGEDGGMTAEQRFVRIGESKGDYVSVIEGVQPGEQVVTDGAFKLQNGAPIAINDAGTISPSESPKPENR